MRTLLPLIPDPPTRILQGEELRSASAAVMSFDVGTPAFNAPLLASLRQQLLIEGDTLVNAEAGIVRAASYEGLVPRQDPRVFTRQDRPRANGGIMTSAGFIPVYANECMIRLFERATNRFTVSGVTRDNTGAALGACKVLLLKGEATELVAATVSDGSGNFSFTVAESGGYMALAFNGGRDRRGASIDMTVVHTG